LERVEEPLALDQATMFLRTLLFPARVDCR